VCSLHYATVEVLKETPKLRQVLGEDKANILWPETKAAFRYRNPTPRRGKKWENSNT
jgi:hypothetical protein